MTIRLVSKLVKSRLHVHDTSVKNAVFGMSWVGEERSVVCMSCMNTLGSKLSKCGKNPKIKTCI